MTVFHMKPAKSSSIKATGYDPVSKTLAITFINSAKRYVYQDVDQDTVDAMHRAESIGKFVGAHIVGKFPHQAHETA